MDRRKFLETLSLPAISLLPLHHSGILARADRKVSIGIEPTANGHRIVEIAAVEIIGQQISGVNFRRRMNPDQDSDADPQLVHELVGFLRSDTLIFHDAPHHLEFLKHEFSLARQAFAPARGRAVINTYELARGKQFSHAFLENLFAPVDFGPDDDTLAVREAIWVARLYLAMTA